MIGAEREAALREEVRRRFISARIRDPGPLGFGRRSEIPLEPPKIVNGFRVGNLPEASRSAGTRYQPDFLPIRLFYYGTLLAGMRALFEDERKQLMNNLIERTVKDTSFKNTMPR